MKYVIIIIFFGVLSSDVYSICNTHIAHTNIDTLQINNKMPLVKVVSIYDTLYHNDIDIYDLITTIKIFDLKSDSLKQELVDTSDYRPRIFFKDINLDNYIDIELTYEDDRANSYSNFWIYYPTKNKFLYSESFIGLENYYLNTDARILSTDIHSYLANGSFSTLQSQYKIIGNNLVLFEEESASSDGENEVTKKTSLIKGFMKTTELDSIIKNNRQYIFKNYRVFNDSLLISKIYWANDKKVKLADSSNFAIYFETELTGTLKCYKKEIYNYSINSTGNLEYVIKKYIVENEKWLRIK